MNFVLVILILSSGKPVPMVQYPSEEVCRAKIEEMDKDAINRNPGFVWDCMSADNFKTVVPEEKE